MRKLAMPLLRMWHAALFGGFAVAYVTADEDTYAMHLFAGYLVLALVVARVLAGMVADPAGVLNLRRPGRRKVLTVMAVALLAAIGVSGATGVLADFVPAAEDLHEGVSETSLWAVFAHVAVILAVFKGRKIRQWLGERLAQAVPAVMVAILAVSPALAGPRDDIIAGYEKEARAADPSFTGFSPQRGEALFRSRNTANPDVPSCTTCHTADPTARGKHHKTGRAIDPVAVSANPKRFTEADKVEERFARDCKNVLGRVCTPAEKGDYLVFMASK